MINPFQVHSDFMGKYNTMIETPVTGQDQEQLNGTPGNYVVYGASKIEATIGAFEVRDIILPAGGISPRLMGEAIIQKSKLAPTINFRTGHKLRVVQVGGSARECQIESVQDTFLEWRISLWDKSQNV